MLGLNDDRTYPRSSFTGVQFCCTYEFRITPAIRTFCKPLNGYTEQALAQKYDQYLELIVAQVLISKLHLSISCLVLLSFGCRDVCRASAVRRLNQNLNVLIGRYKCIHQSL